MKEGREECTELWCGEVGEEWSDGPWGRERGPGERASVGGQSLLGKGSLGSAVFKLPL